MVGTYLRRALPGLGDALNPALAVLFTDTEKLDPGTRDRVRWSFLSALCDVVDERWGDAVYSWESYLLTVADVFRRERAGSTGA